MKIPGCEQCGAPINHSGFCNSKCRKAFINDPIRIQMMELARSFRARRSGLITVDDQMADFAIHLFELFGVEISESRLKRFYDSRLRPLSALIRKKAVAAISE